MNPDSPHRVAGTLRQKAWRALSAWLPWLFIGVILVLVYYGLADVRVMAADAAGTATLTAAELKDRIDELKWILGLIVTTAGLFTIAQGIAAGFNAQNFTRQAESSVAQLSKMEADFKRQADASLQQFTDLEASVRARFPVYTQMEEQRAAILQSLTRILEADSPVDPDEGFYWRRGFYEKLPVQYRRELIHAEQIVPYEIEGRNEVEKTYVLKLRRLARFYWSKFIYEFARGSSSLGDLEHAEYLLDLAIRKVGPAFYLLNDRGNIHIEYFNALSRSLSAKRRESDLAELQRTLNRARQSFEDSIQARREQMRAYYDLAYIWGDLDITESAKQKSLEKAIAYLREGFRHPDWEHEPVAEFTCSALYNLACYYARLASSNRFAARAWFCVLRKAAKLGKAPVADVNNDFDTETGDFFKLSREASPAVQNALKQMRRDLSRNVA